MSEQVPGVINTDMLGPEIMSCRRAPGYMMFVVNGFEFPRLLYYLVYPVIMFPFMAAIPTFGVYWLLDGVTTWTRPPTGVPLLLTTLLVFYAPIFWCVYIWPRSSRLTLHDHGIRGNWPFKRFAARFDEVDHILLGHKAGAIKSAILVAGSYFGNTAAVAQILQMENALSLILRDGRTIWLGFILATFDAEDVGRWLTLASAKVEIRIVRRD